MADRVSRQNHDSRCTDCVNLQADYVERCESCQMHLFAIRSNCKEVSLRNENAHRCRTAGVWYLLVWLALRLGYVLPLALCAAMLTYLSGSLSKSRLQPGAQK